MSEENCIFVGMVTKDLDVSELANTITSLGREIEESGRVIVMFCRIPEALNHSEQVLNESFRFIYITMQRPLYAISKESMIEKD